MSTPRVRSVDIHAHWYPIEWLKMFEREAPSEGGKLERDANRFLIRTARITNAFDQSFVDIVSEVNRNVRFCSKLIVRFLRWAGIR